MATDMQRIQFWLNNREYKEAIMKLGNKSELYGFAKKIFLKEIKELEEMKKDGWFECPSCHAEYYRIVKATIEEKTGRLIPTCDCGVNLVRRIKKIAD